MKQKIEMLEEYDFSKGIRGKYVKQYKDGVNVVKIDDDISKIFPTAKAVNEALRTFVNLVIKKSNYQFQGA